MDFDLTGSKTSVFNRLYQLSVTRQQQKASASQSQLLKPKARGPRSQVELDLIARHHKTQAKLHYKRVQSASRERLQHPGVPQINALSQRLASHPKNNEPEKKDSASVHVADTLRTKQRRKTTVSNSLSVTFKESVDNQSTCDIKVNLSKFTAAVSKDRPSASPSKLQSTPRVTPHGVNYSSLTNRLTGNSSSKREVKHKSYADLETDLVSRTKYWQHRKEEKLQKQREVRQEQELAGCTFRPLLSPARTRQSSRTQSMSQLSRRTSYSRLAPNSMKFCYPYGLDVKTFLKKARPMVDYTAVVTLK